MNKELIKQWGESTAYSAKSHFKSADIKRLWIKGLVIINLLFAIISIIEIGLPDLVKYCGIVSLIASVLLLVYESQEDKNTLKRHMSIGDEYLKLHYELQELFFSDQIDVAKAESISTRLKKMTNKDKPIIHQIGKWMAKRAIEKKGEMTTWWK
ncbi:MAG: hypothetical protein J5I52_07210 [Saprospiraceae bacterium]|nr:MAG: hypothetical protein UZ09_BCD002001021 [Bacteroidetes bacterium OLB9]MCO6463921.1 hypothetical protein [Saprospiraceae bacterium]MCZ2339375.1 hypothetical protein [Chitinophagales bacterium]